MADCKIDTITNHKHIGQLIFSDNLFFHDDTQQMKTLILTIVILVLGLRPACAETCDSTGGITQFGGFVLCASSVLASKKGNDYGPLSAFGGDESTAWVEGVPGCGHGQWLRLEFDGEMTFQSLFVSNGYSKSEDSFQNNGRVRKALIEAADQFKQEVLLVDRMGLQEIRLERKVDSSWVKLTILSTYPGVRWPDTAISEFHVDLEEYNYDFGEESLEIVEQANAGSSFSENEAIDRILMTGEIEEWVRAVGRAGNRVIWRKEQDSPTNCVGSTCFWCFRFLEDLPTHTSSFGVYCIDPHTLDVSHINVATEQMEPVLISPSIQD